jgi:hypothetical protein
MYIHKVLDVYMYIMILMFLTFIADHLNPEVLAHLALDAISSNYIVTLNIFDCPLIVHLNFYTPSIPLVSPVPVTEQGRVLRETAQEYIVKVMLREVIRVSIRESLLKVSQRVFVVRKGTRLLIIVEMVHFSKDFTAEYMGLIVVGCPVV